jgi:hypothetical protein
MDMHLDDVAVEDNEGESQYEARVGDEMAFLAYERAGDRIIFIHTQVPEALEGQGIAAKLAHTALEEARARHLRVTPLCPYVAGYIRRHQEYLDLVDQVDRARVLKG